MPWRNCRAGSAVTAHDANQIAQVITGAQILLDGEPVGITPATIADVRPGLRRLTVKAERYKPLETEVDVEGMGNLQKLDLPLVPGWAGIWISSIPEGAQVFLDGKGAGRTPLHLDLDEGAHSLKVSMERYKSRQIQLEVKANQPITFGTHPAYPGRRDPFAAHGPERCNGDFERQICRDNTPRSGPCLRVKSTSSGFQNPDTRNFPRK